LHRKGIALLMTLAFVSAIAALIAIGGNVLQQGFKQTGTKAFLIQSNAIFPNIYTILQQNSADINDSDALDIFLSVPLFFENKQNGIMMDISFVSDASKVNINRLIPAGGNTVPASGETAVPTDPAVENYLTRILTVYNVSDTILLISMIADSIDMDTNERSTGSEITLDDPDFMQGRLYNMHHFKQLLNAYKRQTLDFNVDDIPWENLIGFRNDKIDFNHIEPETLQFIDPAIDMATLAELTSERTETYRRVEDLPIAPESKQRLKELGAEFYASDVIGTMNVLSKERKVTYTFAYDLAKQKVSELAVSN
jgi:hypothetical protein